MSLRQFHQESEKGFPAPAYLFHSTEDFLLYEALSVLKDKFDEPGTLNFEVIDLAASDERLPVEKLTDILYAMPFFGSRKTLVLRNCQKWNKKDSQKFAEYFKAPSTSSLLVMLFSGAPKDIEPSLLNGAKSLGLSISEREIPVWINERAAKRGIKFTPAAIDYLITFAGTDLGMLHSEVEKFGLSESGRQVDVDEVRSVVYAGAEYGAFDLINALTRKDAREVFRIYESLETALEPPMLLGALNWQYSNMAARGRGPAMDRKKLDAVFSLLHEADLAVKLSHSHVMEDLLVKLLKV